jgi:hypothetical protein
MHRILASTAVRTAVYLLIGIVGVVELDQGESMGWIVVGSSGALIALRILSVWLRRRQAELVAREAARRAEPGYVAPIIDPAELSRRRTRYVKIIMLMCTAPFIAIAIPATWIAVVSTSYLQAYAVVIASAMLLSAGATLLGLRRSFRKIRDNG